MKRKPKDELCPAYQRELALVNGLSIRHRQLMRDLCAGYTLKQAAARCGYTKLRAYKITRSDAFELEMKKMQRELDEKVEDNIAGETTSVAEVLKNASVEAAKGLVELSEDEDKKVRLASIKDILDRTGHKAPAEVIASVSMEADEGLKHMLGNIISEDKEDDAETD
jgi:hypothetical protein